MLARNSLITVSGSIVPLIVTIVTLPFLLNTIGLERYGALALCWLILIYVGQADWGLGKATTYRVARLTGKDETGARGAMVTAMATAMIVGVLMAVLAAAVSWVFFAGFFDVSENLRDELVDSVVLIGLGTWATSFLQVQYGILAGRERFSSATAAMTLSNASLPLLALATAVFIDTSLVALMAATLAGRLLGVAVAGSDIWLSLLRGHAIEASVQTARKLLGFGFWIMAANFTAPVLITIDRMIIGSNLGATAVAVYTIPYQIVSRLQLVPQALMNVLFPRFSVFNAEEARRTAGYSAVTISALFLPIVIGLVFLLEPLLDLWLGNALDPRSVAVGMLLLCAFLFTAVSQSIVVYLQSQNDGKFVAAFQMAEILPYAAILSFAAYTYGLLGVAGAFLARRIVETIGFVMRSKFGSGRFWMSQLPAIAGVGVALWLEPQISSLAARLAWSSAIALLAFAAAIFAAPPDLRRLLAEQLRLRLKRA